MNAFTRTVFYIFVSLQFFVTTGSFINPSSSNPAENAVEIAIFSVGLALIFEYLSKPYFLNKLVFVNKLYEMSFRFIFSLVSINSITNFSSGIYYISLIYKKNHDPNYFKNNILDLSVVFLFMPVILSISFFLTKYVMKLHVFLNTKKISIIDKE